jgi:ZIP family zinc transporter
MEVSKIWLAGEWGAVSGFALVAGAVIGYFTSVSQRVVAAIMSFGSGVLISALSFNLIEEAYQKGGFVSAVIGFIGGALIFTVANMWLNKKGAKHRKRSGTQQPREDSHSGSGLAIAMGSLLDGIPESIVIGTSLITNPKINIIAVAAITLSNFPEGLSSSSGMKKAGRSAKYVIGLWSVIGVVCAISSCLGYILFARVDPEVCAVITALAAGAILAMLVDTMIPEAFEVTHDYTGIITVAGFLTAYIISKLSGD